MSTRSRWITSWHEAEANAAEWMRGAGYPDACVTTGGADAGVDVRSSRALAQVKYEASRVGRPALQRLFGARGSRTDLDLLFFTGSGYSTHAVDYAATTGIALFTYAQDGKVSPVNALASEVARKCQDEDQTDVEAELERLRARVTAPGYRPAAGPPTNPRRAGWWAIALGLFCVWGLVAGLFNTENYDDRGDIVSVVMVVPLLGLGAYFSLRFGIRRLRR